jgi:hypothetical protein
MRPLIFDLLFKDDRMFILEVSVITRSLLTSAAPETREWAVITRRNVSGYPPVRTDSFSSRAEAVTYYEKTVVGTPRVSLGSKSPASPPSLDEYTEWLVSERLYDPLLNPNTEVKPDA